NGDARVEEDGRRCLHPLRLGVRGFPARRRVQRKDPGVEAPARRQAAAAEKIDGLNICTTEAQRHRANLKSLIEYFREACPRAVVREKKFGCDVQSVNTSWCLGGEVFDVLWASASLW